MTAIPPTADPNGSKVQGPRPVACERCRKRRSFCTKELPKCARCLENGLDCVYPEGRKITISENYLRSLEARVKQFEDARAEESSTTVQGRTSLEGIDGAKISDGSSEHDLGVKQVLQGVSVLTFNATGHQRAQYIEGFASTALSRRLKTIAGIQSPDDMAIACEPSFYNREALRIQKNLSNTPVPLPPIHVAKRWYGTYYSYIGTIFAFSTQDWFDQELVNVYSGPPSSTDSKACLAYAKVLTILAFGQLYSVNEWNSFEGPPGFELFCHVLQYLPSIHEESTLLFVETLALVGYYMQNLGERDAAFLYVGASLRMAISLALHQEVRSPLLGDAQKEWRRRVWWSVYSMDRILTIKSGNPLMVQDDDIDVDLPSRLIDEPEYGPWIVLRKYTELSKILTRITHDVYGAHKKSEPTQSNLMTSVQSILAALSAWNHSLPFELRFNIDRLEVTRESVSTFLHYYQCINMTVRPLLFLVVERRMKNTKEKRPTDWRHDLSPLVIDAIDTCIAAAQDTVSTMMIMAQKDLFATFGYMDGEHCFSAALVLLLVCVAFPCTEQDYDTMDSALRMLHSVVGRGNNDMSSRFQLLLQVRSCVVMPTGSKLSELLDTDSTSISHSSSLDPMSISGPQVDNVTLDELLQVSGPGMFSLWGEGYSPQDLNMEFDDLLQWTRPADGA